MIISETKLDDTFNDNLFVTNGYKLERKDRNAKGGGLMVFYKSDLPIRRIKNFECEVSESIFPVRSGDYTHRTPHGGQQNWTIFILLKGNDAKTRNICSFCVLIILVIMATESNI